MFYAGLILKYWKEITFAVCLLFVALFAGMFGAIQSMTNVMSGDGTGGTAEVNEKVARYEPLIEKYAEQYGIPEYVDLLMAKMMQESGGMGGDPMQASESLGLPMNTIQSPEKSIEQGVKYFAGVLEQAGGDVKLALQSYNFGGGFIEYAKARGGYSKEVAASFSAMKEAELGWDRYGDVNYVENVLRYYSGGQFNGDIGELAVSQFGFMKPVEGVITSGYGMRLSPFSSETVMHWGKDYGCSQQAKPIYAIADGTVTKAGWQNPNNHNEGFGQHVYVNHGSGLVTIYGHLSQILVREGQTVKQGQQVGRCGTTGSSTGMHLHLETHFNGSPVNPDNFVGGL